MSKKDQTVYYEGCACSTLCKGECSKKYKDYCPAFYVFKLVNPKNKQGKILRNRWTEIIIKSGPLNSIE